MRILLLLLTLTSYIFAGRVELLNESFDNNSMPEQWSIIDDNQDNNSWIIANASTHSGLYSVAIGYLSSGNNDWLITPQIDLGSSSSEKILTFWSRNQLLDLEMKLSTTDNNVSDFDTDLEITREITGTWSKYQVILPVTNGEIYLAWYATTINSFFLYLDDIVLTTEATEIPIATTEISPLSGSENIDINGFLEWEKSTLAEGYKLFLGTDNPPTNIINGEEIGNLTNFEYQNLLTTTEYYWQVVPFNSIGDATDCPIWNFSTFSNQWGGVTVSPLIIDIEIDQNQVTSQEIIIDNSGANATELNYSSTILYTSDEKDNSRSNRAYGFTADVLLSFDLDTPEDVDYESDVNGLFYAADFTNIDSKTMYGINNDNNNLYSVDITTGEQTHIGNCNLTLPYGIWSDLAYNRVTETMYACATSSLTSELYTVNLSNAEVTLISEIPNIKTAIGMAIDGNGDGYIYDMYSDKGYKIDLLNASVVELGALGFNADYAQSMSWDAKTDNIYMTACTLDSSTFRLFNRETGQAEYICSQPGQIYGLGFNYIPETWLSIENNTGIIEPNGTETIMLNIDPASIDFSGDITTKQAEITFSDANGNHYSENVIINLIVTNTEIEGNYELAITNYELKQNYPNPFNPITKINYRLPVETMHASSLQSAKIEVYNTIGQMVWSTPVTRYGISPVTGSILFDGSKFNSGVYYYSLIVDGKKIDTKSMILIK